MSLTIHRSWGLGVRKPHAQGTKPDDSDGLSQVARRWDKARGFTRGEFIDCSSMVAFQGESEPRSPPLPLFHSFTNSFQSAMLCGLRISAVTGSSFGARGTVSSFKPA